MGDRGEVAACLVFRRAGDRRRQQPAEGVDDLMVGGPGEEVGRVGGGGRVHAGTYTEPCRYVSSIFSYDGSSVSVGVCGFPMLGRVAGVKAGGRES